MTVPIERASLEQVGAPLSRSVRSARTAWVARRGVVVDLRAAGHGGLGEASPLPGYSPDSLDTAQRCLEAALPRLAPLDLEAPADEAVTASLAPAAAALSPSPSARFALETALLDLAGKLLGAPVSRLLSRGRDAAPVRRSALIDHALPIEQQLDRARAARALGVRCFKRKLTAHDLADRSSLDALAASLGGAELRLDANGSLTAEQARHALDTLGALGVSFIEEPCAGEALLSLRRGAVPWAADESLSTPGLAERLIAAEGCAAVVLKPALLGLLRARELASLAAGHGKGVVVTHLFDGPIALASACELALSLWPPPLACGLELHDGLSAYDTVVIPQLAVASHIIASGLPGHGVEVW